MKKSNGKNIYHVTFTGDENLKDGYDIELQSQKWNHIVFNYNETYVDLYINGILERTFYLRYNKNIIITYLEQTDENNEVKKLV